MENATHYEMTLKQWHEGWWFDTEVLCPWEGELNDEQFLNLRKFFGLYTTSDVSMFNAYILNIQSAHNITLNQKNLRKFEEHIKLSCHQRSFIIKNVIEAKTIADDAKKLH